MPRIHKRVYDDMTACLKKAEPDIRKKNPRIKSSFQWGDVTCADCLKQKDNGAVNFIAQTSARGRAILRKRPPQKNGG